MAVGKSSLGKRLARRLQMPFVDLDKLIEAKYGASIAGLFESRGENWFREEESALLHAFVRSADEALMATGGGAPVHHHNVELMRASGLVIWLKLPSKTIARRILQSPNERPLLQGLEGSELLQRIQEQLIDRSRFYARAHMHLDVESPTAADVEHWAQMIEEHPLYSR